MDNIQIRFTPVQVKINNDDTLFIINLDSDSDTDSERDHDREGETTDMYWSE
jgi:hypothetical protein